MITQADTDPAILLMALTHDALPLQAPEITSAGFDLAQAEHDGFYSVYIPLRTSRLTALLATDDVGALQAIAGHYYQAQNHLSAAGDLLPIRFGTMLPSVDAIAPAFEGQVDQIRNRLDAVQGQQEWTLELYAKQPAKADSDKAENTTGINYLRQKRAAKQSKELHFLAYNEAVATLINGLANSVATQIVREPGQAMNRGQDSLDANRDVSDRLRLLCPRQSTTDTIGAISAVAAKFLPDHLADASRLIGPEAPFYFGRLEAFADAA